MPKLLAASQIVALTQLLLFTAVRTSSGVYEDFGFEGGVRPALAGFLLFQQLIGPVDEVRRGLLAIGLLVVGVAVQGWGRRRLMRVWHGIGMSVRSVCVHSNRCAAAICCRRCWACCPTWCLVSASPPCCSCLCAYA